MSLDPQPQPDALPDEPLAAQSGRTPPARIWWWAGLLAFFVGALGVWGIFSALRNPPELQRPPSLAARLRDSTAGPVEQSPPASEPPERVPLDPLVPETGAGLIDEAERVAADLAQRFPQNPDAHEMLARFQFEFADLDQAASAWQRCLELNPQYAYAHAGLAKIAAQRGDHGAAVAHCRRAVLADPAALSHQIELGKALLAAGDIDEAIAVLAGAVKADLTSPQSHAELGNAQLQKRDDAAAKASFEAVLKLDPRYATAYSGLAVACARLGLVEQAREQEAKVREFRADRKQELRGQRLAYDDDQALREDIARLYTEMAGVWVAEGRPAAAEQLWRRASRLHPENRPSRQGLAWLSVQQDKPWEAILMLRELARLEPDNAAYPAEIARLYVTLNRLDDAEHALEGFAEATPDSAAAQRALAEFHLQVKKQPQSACEHARRAAELSGAAADWALLSTAHELAGELPPAVAALEEASRLASENLQYRQLLALLKQRAAAAATKAEETKGIVPSLEIEPPPNTSR